MEARFARILFGSLAAWLWRQLDRHGLSRGVRLAKPLLELAGLEDEVDIRVEPGAVISTAAVSPRAGCAAAALGPTALLNAPTASASRSEWERSPHRRWPRCSASCRRCSRRRAPYRAHPVSLSEIAVPLLLGCRHRCSCPAFGARSNRCRKLAARRARPHIRSGTCTFRGVWPLCSRRSRSC